MILEKLFESTNGDFGEVLASSSSFRRFNHSSEKSHARTKETPPDIKQQQSDHRNRVHSRELEVEVSASRGCHVCGRVVMRRVEK